MSERRLNISFPLWPGGMLWDANPKSLTAKAKRSIHCLNYLCTTSVSKFKFGLDWARVYLSPTLSGEKGEKKRYVIKTVDTIISRTMGFAVCSNNNIYVVMIRIVGLSLRVQFLDKSLIFMILQIPYLYVWFHFEALAMFFIRRRSFTFTADCQCGEYKNETYLLGIHLHILNT